MPLREVQGITKTRLFKYIKNFTTKKGIFQINNSYSLHTPAQNIGEAVLKSTHNLCF